MSSGSIKLLNRLDEMPGFASQQGIESQPWEDTILCRAGSRVSSEPISRTIGLITLRGTNFAGDLDEASAYCISLPTKAGRDPVVCGQIFFLIPS